MINDELKKKAELSIGLLAIITALIYLVVRYISYIEITDYLFFIIHSFFLAILGGWIVSASMFFIFLCLVGFESINSNEKNKSITKIISFVYGVGIISFSSPLLLLWMCIYFIIILTLYLFIGDKLSTLLDITSHYEGYLLIAIVLVVIAYPFLKKKLDKKLIKHLKKSISKKVLESFRLASDQYIRYVRILLISFLFLIAFAIIGLCVCRLFNIGSPVINLEKDVYVLDQNPQEHIIIKVIARSFSTPTKEKPLKINLKSEKNLDQEITYNYLGDGTYVATYNLSTLTERGVYTIHVTSGDALTPAERKFMVI